MKKTNRQIKRETKKNKKMQQKVLSFVGYGLAIIVVFAVIFVLVTKLSNSINLIGDEVSIPSRNHVPPGTLPGPYNSNPPAGGVHYDSDFPAKFYKESDLAALPLHPEGYLVHDLEHGYVIFWYNCQAPNTDCSALRQTIQKVMDETGNTKLIAFPWSDMDIPLAMTSWGRILKFTIPNPAIMKRPIFD
jgi:hypothetical protein